MSDAAVAAPASPAAPDAPAVAPAEAPAVEAPKADAKGARGPDGKFAKAEGAKPEPKAVEETKAAAVERRKLKLKIDGAEEEWEGTDEDIVREIQKAKAADKRFQEGAQARKDAVEREARVSNLLKAMTENPRAFAAEAKSLGVDPVKLATEILQPMLDEQIAAEQEKTMSPEQKRAAELERRVKQYEAEAEERKATEERTAKERAAAERQTAVNQHIQSYEQQIIEAIEASGLPKSPALASEVVAVLSECLERGLDVTPKDIVAELHARKSAEMKALLEKFDDGSLDKFIPKSVQEKLRKAEVAKFKASSAMHATPATVSKAPAPATVRAKPLSMAALQRDISLGKFDR